jgi:hypothetical protein
MSDLQGLIKYLGIFGEITEKSLMIMGASGSLIECFLWILARDTSENGHRSGIWVILSPGLLVCIVMAAHFYVIGTPLLLDGLSWKNLFKLGDLGIPLF